MILYHGSTKIVKNPEVDFSQKNGDFGRGFYTTLNKEQAEEWSATKLQGRKTAQYAIVNVYQFEVPENARIKEFKERNAEWLRFIEKGRNGYQFNEYDIIIGPLAGDGINKTIALYESGELSEEIALQLLGATVENKGQTVFISQKFCDKLEFVNHYVYMEKNLEKGEHKYEPKRL